VKILLTVASLLPQYGGPARSVSKLALALVDAGVDVSIWAADNSAMTTPFIPQAAALRRESGDLRQVIGESRKPDIVHDNGIWWAHNHRLARLTARHHIPRVVSLRGALEPWARNHKRLKKDLAWWFYQRRDLQLARTHHATSHAESCNLGRLGLSVPISVIPIGIDIPQRSSKIVNEQTEYGNKIALFLGRIYPVKGLPMLVQAWARVRPEGWRLLIAGPDEAGHRREVEAAIQAAKLDQAITFLGPLEGEEKETAFRDAELFVLPSHSENFGVAIAEALAHGLPVLTTKSTPWAAISEHGCGWWVDASVDGLARALRQATLLELPTLRKMGEKGRSWVKADFNWGHVAKEFVALYEDILRDPVTGKR